MKRFNLVEIMLVIILVASLFGIGIAQQPAAAAGTGPCDIYGNCVAAHSTVRALYGSYNGNLYQVNRASDGATTNIGLLSAGGYANAAAQDSFCSATTCTITESTISPEHGNNLTVGPAGGAAGADTASSANAAQITIAGHEAYGVYINGSGNGYRDDATSGVATGDNPEGEYEVLDGRTTAAGALTTMETPDEQDDDGAGTMGSHLFRKYQSLGLRLETAPGSWQLWKTTFFPGKHRL